MSLLVHRLVIGARLVLGRVDPDSDDRRPAGLLDRLARAPQRRGDLAGIAHGLAVVAQHVPEYLEVDVAELVADVAALLAVLDDLAAADLVHRRVVADHRYEGRVEAVGGLAVRSEEPTSELPAL